MSILSAEAIKSLIESYERSIEHSGDAGRPYFPAFLTWSHECRHRTDPLEYEKIFSRVTDSYDLGLMADTRLVTVGVGGAQEWCLAMARAGVGQFVFIDPDSAMATNIATQYVFWSDLGKPKVDFLARRVIDINPKARVLAIPSRLEDISDEDIARLCGPIGGVNAGRIIIAGMTDNFLTQGKINRLSLNLGLPSLCAQIYKEGRAAEVTFTIPGVSRACHRCILQSRYRFYLDEGGVNPITSAGSTIFTTSWVNALCGYIATAMIHHGSGHHRWGPVGAQIGARNLVQLRLDPAVAETVGIGTFNRVFASADQERLHCGEPIWLPQEPESGVKGRPICPDCGGTGNLLDSVGRFKQSNLI